MSNLPSSYALVTGGSSGMGLEYVKQLADKGYCVIIVALRQEEADPVAAAMAAAHPTQDFIAIGMDLAVDGAGQRLYDTVTSLRPEAHVEVLINNAGIIHIRHFREMTVEQIERIILLHNVAMATLCRLFIPAMTAEGRGYVLNISSMTAWLPYPFVSTYAATKSFTKVLTRALRTEYVGTGVHVAAIYFGAVDTPLYTLTDAWRRRLRRLGIMITPQKAAKRALCMLFRGRSGWMPGLVNKLAVVVCPLLPSSLIACIDRKVTKRMKNEK